MVRFALLGCAAAGLAWPAAALAEETADPRIAVAGDTAAAPRVRRAARKVVVLPPARPDVAEPAAVDAPGDRTPAHESFAKVASLSVVPPLRSSFQFDGAPAAPQIQPAVESARAAAPSVTDVAAEQPHPEMRAAIPPPRPDFAEVPAPAITIVAILPPERPAFAADVATTAIPYPQPAQPQPSRSLFGALFGRAAQPTVPAAPPIIRTGHDFLDERIAHHAVLNEVPATLVHRVVVRESKYNPRAVGRGGALGLMQIKHATARGLGYDGPASGLLDAETNLTYAVKYLAGAYRLADGNHDRAVQHYARGYYYEAKRRNARLALKARNERPQRQADAAAALDGAAADGEPAQRSLFLNAR